MANETDTISISSDISDAKKIEEPRQLYNTTSLSSINSENVGSESHSLFRPLSNFIEQVKLDNRLSQVESQNKIELEPNDALNRLIRNNDEEKQIGSSDNETDQEILPEEDLPPDGGYGWVCCFCNMFFNAATWGTSSAFGIFLAYYLETDYFKGATPTDFALVGGLLVGVAQIFAPFILLLIKLVGFKQTLLMGTVLQMVGMLLASFATQIWQLYVTQGIIVGISFALLFVPSSLVVQNWFYHKRSLAGGIGACGSGVGGLTFSLAANRLIIETGNHKWALRMIAIVTFVLNVISTYLIRLRKTEASRAEEKMSKRELLRASSKIIFDANIFRQLPVQLIAIWYGLYTMAYTIVLFSLSAYGRSIGLTQSQASNITMFMNVAQLVGRPALGFIADRFGRVNMSMTMTTLIIILIFSFWLNCTNYASLSCFSLICGAIMGCGQVNFISMIADSVSTALYPAAFAYCIAWSGSLGVPAEVVGLNLRFDYLHNAYLWCQVMSGLLFSASLVFLLPFREWKVRKLLNERRSQLQSCLEAEQEGEKEEKVKLLGNYEKLLQSGVSHYFLRLFYPIKA